MEFEEGDRRLENSCSKTSFKTKSIYHSIYKTSETPLCRLCGDSTETARHIVSGCKKLAQREYRKRHNKVALQAHWEMCRKYGIECTDKWYDHQPLPVAENREVRITWDTTVYTDKVLKHNRSNISIVHKDAQEWTLIDIYSCASRPEYHQDRAGEGEKVSGPSIRNQKNSWSLKSNSDTHRD